MQQTYLRKYSATGLLKEPHSWWHRICNTISVAPVKSIAMCWLIRDPDPIYFRLDPTPFSQFRLPSKVVPFRGVLPNQHPPAQQIVFISLQVCLVVSSLPVVLLICL